MTPVLHLHIGPRKSGTTYLQRALVANAPSLASAGIRYPLRGVTGKRGLNHEEALLDAASPQPGDQASALRSALTRADPDVVLSGEASATLTQYAASRLVSYLGVDAVHVVITARDISRVLPSVWQQNVRSGQGGSFTSFLDSIRIQDEERRRAPVAWQMDPAQNFWREHSIAELAERWRDCVDRVTVVTVPVTRTDPALLWRRFLESVGVDMTHLPDLASLTSESQHEGVTASEALVLLEIMQQLSRSGMPIMERKRWAIRLVREVFEPRQNRGQPLTTPHEMWPLAQAWAARDIEQLTGLVADGRVALVGDLEDLRVDSSPPPPAREAQLAKEIADLGGRCITYLEAAR